MEERVASSRSPVIADRLSLIACLLMTAVFYWNQSVLPAVRFFHLTCCLLLTAYCLLHNIDINSLTSSLCLF